MANDFISIKPPHPVPYFPLHIRNPQHPYTKLLISAVPDPDLPFGNLVESEPNYSIDADEIRKRSSIVIEGCKQVGDNHFVKHWDEAA